MLALGGLLRMLKLEPGHLTWEAIEDLAPRIRPEDILECANGDAFTALLLGSRWGPSWTILKPLPDGSYSRLGAFGYAANLGTIWSLFSELSPAESRAVLRHTPLWVKHMLAHSGRDHLWNFVHSHNRSAQGWLQASRCFLIDWRPTILNHDTGVPSFYFTTKPLERLP